MKYCHACGTKQEVTDIGGMGSGEWVAVFVHRCPKCSPIVNEPVNAETPAEKRQER
jgi:hypothetical protein